MLGKDGHSLVLPEAYGPEHPDEALTVPETTATAWTTPETSATARTDQMEDTHP